MRFKFDMINLSFREPFQSEGHGKFYICLKLRQFFWTLHWCRLLLFLDVPPSGLSYTANTQTTRKVWFQIESFPMCINIYHNILIRWDIEFSWDKMLVVMIWCCHRKDDGMILSSVWFASFLKYQQI